MPPRRAGVSAVSHDGHLESTFPRTADQKLPDFLSTESKSANEINWNTNSVEEKGNSEILNTGPVEK